MAYHGCPHCNRKNAWYELLNEYEVVERCWCGHWKVVYTDIPGVDVNQVVPKNKVSLPSKGTKLSKCLGCLADFEGYTSTTGKIAERLELKGADAASQLMVLQHKGLVQKTMDRRGKAGGSTWVLTSRARKYLKLKLRITMALTLTVKEGQKVYVDDIECLIQEVCSTSKIKIKVFGNPWPCTYTCTKIRTTEILPNVRCSVVDGGDRNDRTVKIVLEAPREIVILRESIYKKDGGTSDPAP